MKLRAFGFWAAACAAGVIGCAGKTMTFKPASIAGMSNPSIHILADRTREAPVKGTFGWGYCLFRIAPHMEEQIGPLGERLQRAMRASFAAKGLTFAEAEPDLLVSYALAGESAIDDTDLNQAYGALLKAPVAAAEAGLHYKRGVLVLDVAERSSGHLLWRGAIMADIDLTWPEARKQERCDAVINELLRHYPKP